MAKLDEFVAFIHRLKAVSATITHEQRIGLLQQATQEFDIPVNEAVQILSQAGLIVGVTDDYFDILDTSIAELRNLTEDEIATHVNAIHKKLYAASLAAGGLPRPDGRSQEQWRTLLNQARDTLIDSRKRHEHIASLQGNSDRLNIADNNSAAFDFSQVAKTGLQELGNQITPDDVPENMAFIPPGEFQMGSEDSEANEDERPVHNVFLDAFLMDKYPITNAQFQAFIVANPDWRTPDLYGKHISLDFHDGNYLKDWNEGTFPYGKDDHPVIQVSWYAAMAYAEWVGKRLPTEAEWEKAARGGVEAQKYPWGNSLENLDTKYLSNPEDTTPVGNSPINGYGLYDMSGNVWEWCLDTYDADFYLGPEPRNPFSETNNIVWVTQNFRKVRSHRVLRGGPWDIDSQGVRVSHRFSANPKDALPTFGFRCVMDVTT